MKKVFLTLLALLMITTLTACGSNNKDNEPPCVPSEAPKEQTPLTENEAIEFLNNKFCKGDGMSSNTYGFSIIESLNISGEEYFYGRLYSIKSSEPGNPTGSVVNNFFLSKDAKKLYKGYYDRSTSTLTMDTENNLLDG